MNSDNYIILNVAGMAFNWNTTDDKICDLLRSIPEAALPQFKFALATVVVVLRRTTDVELQALADRVVDGADKVFSPAWWEEANKGIAFKGGYIPPSVMTHIEFSDDAESE